MTADAPWDGALHSAELMDDVVALLLERVDPWPVERVDLIDSAITAGRLIGFVNRENWRHLMARRADRTGEPT